MSAGARQGGPPPWVWPALGIGALVAINAGFDVAAGRSPVGPGSFLYISRATGVPAGAMIDIVAYGGVIAVLALGMAPVVALRGVDLSVGSVMAMAGAAAATLAARGAGGATCIGAGLIVGLACGLWNAALVCGVGLQPFVATLVLMVAGRGVAQMITGSQNADFSNAALEYLALGRPPPLRLPFPLVLAGALLGAGQLLVRRTALGLFIEAIGANSTAARLAGLRATCTTAGAYVLCSVCASLAGMMTAAAVRSANPFRDGKGAELGAIFAAVVGGASLSGGRFSLPGAFLGAFLLRALTTTMYARDISDDVAPLPEALVILAVCAGSSERLRGLVRRRRAA